MCIRDRYTEEESRNIQFIRFSNESEAYDFYDAVVDKNINDLARIADMHYVIEKGKIVWQGNSTELLKQKDHLGNKLGV